MTKETRWRSSPQAPLGEWRNLSLRLALTKDLTICLVSNVPVKT